MTPKEKAEELINRFENKTYSQVKDEIAKQCALIAVDEIIKALSKADTCYDLIEHIDFWEEVKQELIKM